MASRVTILEECIELAFSRIRTRALTDALPQVTIQVPAQLPLVRADGDWLVEVLSKLLQRLQIYTGSGKVTIEADWNGSQMLEVTVADTGR